MSIVPTAQATAPAAGRRPAALPTGPPVTTADLDVAWVSAALGLADSGPHALRGVAPVQIGSDRGHLGSSFRLDLDYTARPDGAPASVVVKLPATTPEARATASRGRLYEREYRFFTEFAPLSDVRVPHCYAAGYDEATDTFALVLEDVSSERTVDQIAGCPVELAALALRELAGLHASWWGRAELHDRGWLTTFVHPARLDNLSGLMRDGWPVLCDAFPTRLPAAARAMGREVLDYLPHGLRAVDAAPHTLLHGDPRLDNLLFDAGAQRAPIVLLDWQNTSRGPAAADVAYFLAQSLTPHDLALHGEDLVAGYHDQLTDHAVHDLSLADLRRSLCRALPVSFAVAASLAVLADLGDPRIGELAVGMAERALAAADHMGLHDELARR